jgi:hypothetical protein
MLSTDDIRIVSKDHKIDNILRELVPAFFSRANVGNGNHLIPVRQGCEEIVVGRHKFKSAFVQFFMFML